MAEKADNPANALLQQSICGSSIEFVERRDDSKRFDDSVPSYMTYCLMKPKFSRGAIGELVAHDDKEPRELTKGLGIPRQRRRMPFTAISKQLANAISHQSGGDSTSGSSRG